MAAPPARRRFSTRLEVTYEFLDNRSLLVNSDVFERLVEKATAEQNWDACSGCPSMSLCPFKANRDDLASDDLRRNVLDILRRAEVLDGQIIVFREAVALLSVLLAGCPNDHEGRTPCEWVHDQVQGNRLFQPTRSSSTFDPVRCHEITRPRRP